MVGRREGGMGRGEDGTRGAMLTAASVCMCVCVCECVCVCACECVGWSRGSPSCAPTQRAHSPRLCRPYSAHHGAHELREADEQRGPPRVRSPQLAEGGGPAAAPARGPLGRLLEAERLGGRPEGER